MLARAAPMRLAIVAFAAAAWYPTFPASAANLACQARARYGSHQLPVKVDFQALVSDGVPPHQFHWDFRDGASSTEQNPSHAYAESGVFPATLTVTDTDTPQQICRDTVLVFVNLVVDPICGATASTRWGDAPLAVRFDAYPALVGDPEPYTWSWRFGDGEMSTLQSPSHTYNAIGTHYAVATLPSGRPRECLSKPRRRR